MSSTAPAAGAADSFFAMLAELCAWPLAITIESRSRGSFDAVVLGCDRQSLFYERWSDTLGIATGELGIIDLADIGSVSVRH